MKLLIALACLLATVVAFQCTLTVYSDTLCNTAAGSIVVTSGVCTNYGGTYSKITCASNTASSTWTVSGYAASDSACTGSGGSTNVNGNGTACSSPYKVNCAGTASSVTYSLVVLCMASALAMVTSRAF